MVDPDGLPCIGVEGVERLYPSEHAHSLVTDMGQRRNQLIRRVNICIASAASVATIPRAPRVKYGRSRSVRVCLYPRRRYINHVERRVSPALFALPHAPAALRTVSRRPRRRTRVAIDSSPNIYLLVVGGPSCKAGADTV
ncbi:jg4135 [Pararge aegeria aegeria]|uniref:Jg4135 protein n=1 Tax=Pararge aegeria aegeria TaxID=348720 RepID=A0A8S4R1C7_9NEOP|nr:jg4135 [Pararge aegeria aegeria]